MGHLVPAGTGFYTNRKVDLIREETPVIAAVEPEAETQAAAVEKKENGK